MTEDRSYTRKLIGIFTHSKSLFIVTSDYSCWNMCTANLDMMCISACPISGAYLDTKYPVNSGIPVAFFLHCSWICYFLPMVSSSPATIKYCNSGLKPFSVKVSLQFWTEDCFAIFLQSIIYLENGSLKKQAKNKWTNS